MARRTGSAAAAALLAVAAPAWAAAERELPALELVLDRTEASVGEQVTATLRVLSREPLAGYDARQAPRFESFWVEELATATTLREEPVRRGGETLRSYLVRRLALFPRTPGTHAVVGAAATVRVQARDGGRGRTLELAAAPVDVVARPLPGGAPPGFDPGAVGTWRLDVAAEPPRPAAGEPFVVRLAARGEGNLRALRLPALPAIAGTRRLAERTRDAPLPRGERFGGTRTAEITLVAAAPGRVSIPAIAWPTFDPALRRYVTVRSPELTFDVAPARPVPARADGTSPPRLPSSAAPLVALAAASMATSVLAALVLLRRRRRGEAAPGDVRAPARRPRRAAPAAQTLRREAERSRAHALAAMDDLARGELGAAGALARALEGWSAARLGRSVAGLTRSALAAALAEGGIDRAPAVAAALALCDAARFGGDPDPAELADAAREAIAALEGR